MTHTAAIIQARIGSNRLPGKVLFELAGMPMIGVMLTRLRGAESLDSIVVATGEGSENDALAATVAEFEVPVFRGSEDDVLARYAAAAGAHNADVIVRLTADCPLMDPTVVDQVVNARTAQALDFCTNVLPASWPDGQDVSVFTRSTLDLAAKHARLPSEREHVVPWMWEQSNLKGGTAVRAANVTADHPCPAQRWTIDEAADYSLMRALAQGMGGARLVAAGYREILAFLDAQPEIARLNAHLRRDAGLEQSRAMEKSQGSA